MRSFFRSTALHSLLHTLLHTARYRLAIAITIVFSFTTFQIPVPCPDPPSLQDIPNPIPAIHYPNPAFLTSHPLFPTLDPAPISLPAPLHYLTPGTAHADTAADFNEKFNALTPPDNSSVHSDYLFEQIALGSRFTITLLNQIKDQATANNNRFEKLSEQLDTIIEQNQQIIELLK
jgi:hypothetical protein